MTGMITVVINGETREFAEGSTIGDVLRAMAAPTSGVAVARSGEVVPKASWDRTVVRDGDMIEVLTAVQGG
ncbi:MAG TPA: sulfur carrier protein ThiS [Pseudonocardiaceae bacterium]|jgi:sulfur carrier protein|nr:sulfur carrier protein ThiS [Pseudonocardiaceae bacterium]